MMKLKVCSFLYLMIFVSTAYAQHNLSGRVLDTETGKPVVGAQVFIAEVNKLTATNNKGDYIIENLQSGDYTITVFSYNYKNQKQQISLSGNRVLDFGMKILSKELSEVVISQQKEEVFGLRRLRPVEGTAIYAGKKTEVILIDQLVGNMAANNARQVFSQVVGLNIYDTNDAGLQLSIGGRGLDPNRTANFNTRQNGYDISADVLGYPESYYTPPAEALEQIEVIRGAASLQYGTQFGGLVNFKMKKPTFNKKVELVSRHTLGSFGLFTSFNSLSGTVGKFSYYNYFNYKQGDGYRPNAEFNAKNYFGHFAYQFSDRTKASFDFTYLNYLAKQPGGLTDEQFNLNPKFSNRTRNWFQVDWRLYNFKLEHQLNSKTDLSINVFALDASRLALGYRGIPGADGLNRNPVSERDWRDEQGEYIYTRDLIKGDFNNWGAEARYLTRYKINGQDAAFLVGAKYYNAENTSQQGPGTNSSNAEFNFASEQNEGYANQSDFRFPNQNVALFGENVLYINDQLSFTPGFRLEYIRTESDGSYRYFPDPTDETIFLDTTDNRNLTRSFALLGLGISNVFSPSLELYANFSQNYRSVTFSDIRTVNPSFIIDAGIKDEEGFTADLGLRGKWRKYVSYDIGAYNLLYKDRIGIVLDDRANRVRGNIGDAIIYGFESFIDWNLASTVGLDVDRYRLKWFVNSAITGSRYFNAIEGNNNVNGRKVEFIPLLNLKTGVNSGYKDFLFSAQLTYLSKQFTDVENSGPTADGDARAGIIGEIPAYHILDISFSYSFKQLRLEAGSNNLTDNSYFTRRATGYPGPGIIPSDGRSFYVTLQFKI